MNIPENFVLNVTVYMAPFLLVIIMIGIIIGCYNKYQLCSSIPDVNKKIKAEAQVSGQPMVVLITTPIIAFVMVHSQIALFSELDNFSYRFATSIIPFLLIAIGLLSIFSTATQTTIDEFNTTDGQEKPADAPTADEDLSNKQYDHKTNQWLTDLHTRSKEGEM